MGEAKRRGTLEQRKAEAIAAGIERNRRQWEREQERRIAEETTRRQIQAAREEVRQARAQPNPESAVGDLGFSRSRIGGSRLNLAMALAAFAMPAIVAPAIEQPEDPWKPPKPTK